MPNVKISGHFQLPFMSRPIGFECVVRLDEGELDDIRSGRDRIVSHYWGEDEAEVKENYTNCRPSMRHITATYGDTEVKEPRIDIMA